MADVGLVTDGTQQLGHLQWHGIMPVLALCDTQRNFWVHLGITEFKTVSKWKQLECGAPLFSWYKEGSHLRIYQVNMYLSDGDMLRGCS